MNRVEEIDALVAGIKAEIRRDYGPFGGACDDLIERIDRIAELEVERARWAKSPAFPAHNEGARRKTQ